MVTADTETDPTVARSALDRLVKQEGVDVLVGGQRTEAVMTMQDMLAEHEMIFMGCGSSGDVLVNRVGNNYEKYKYFFMSTPYPSSQMGIGMMNGILDFINKQLKGKLEDIKIAICAEKIEAGEPLVAAFKKYVPKYGWEVVKTVRPSPTATDVTAELSLIEESGANVIITYLSGTVGTQFAKQWGEMEIPAIPIGICVEAQERGFWDRTEGKGEYLISSHTSGIENATPISKKVFDYFMKNHGEYPAYNGYGSYDAIFAWANAVERAGTLEADNVIGELEYDPDPMEYAHFERFGMKVPQGLGTYGVSDLGFTENHYRHYFPYQPNKTIETAVGTCKALAGWPWGQWQNGERPVVYPKMWSDAEAKLPPWM